MSIELVMLTNHLILYSPLLLLPSIFPSLKIVTNESALCIRWPKYWSFSFNPSNEYSGLICFWIDWFNLLSVQGIVQVYYPLITGYSHMVFDLLLSMLIYSNNKLLLTTYSVSVEQCPGNTWSQRNWEKKKRNKTAV